MFNANNHHEGRQHAEETIRKANADLRNPRNANNARKVAMLTTMKKDAMDYIRHHNDMYGNDYRQNDRYNDRHNDRRMEIVHDAMNMLDRILPHITGDDDDDYTNVENRRGGRRGARVRGYYRRRPRADYNDDMMDDYHNDWDDDAEMRRGGRRKRDSRGRFTSDYTNDHMDDMARTAATAAAETVRNMTNDNRYRSDYNANPVMPHNRHNRNDRNDTNDTSDRTHNDTSNIGPGSRR